jgi:hypothetical protein
MISKNNYPSQCTAAVSYDNVNIEEEEGRFLILCRENS